MIEKKRKNPDALFFACQEMGPAEQEQTPRDYLNVILNHQLLVVCEVAVSVSIGKSHHRKIGEVKTQEVVRGPREAFTESVVVNQAMLRERLKNKRLMFQSLTLGTETKTDVKVVYLYGTCKKKLVDDIVKRLKEQPLAGILESHYVELLLETKVKTVFPTVYNTERPDVIAAGLLEGRCAIIVDGTPFVLMLPALMFDFLQSNEDYHQRADIASAIRLLRVLSFFIALRR
jgi:spore germination protein KA